MANSFFASNLSKKARENEAARNLAHNHLRQNNLSAALELLIQLLKNDPSDLLSRLLMARACLRLHNHIEAEKHFKFILQRLPQNVSALSGLADVAQAKGDPAQAMLRAQEILKLKPDSTLGFLAAAHALEAQGKAYEALKALGDCVTLHPDDASARYHWGRALLKVGRVPEGWHELRQVYEAGIQPKPSLSTPWWDGSAIEHLLVIGDQGLGDTIQFSRFIVQVKLRARQITLACDSALTTWLSAALGVTAIPTSSIQELQHEAHLPITVLPSVLDLQDDPYQISALRSFKSANLAPEPLGASPERPRLKIGVSFVCSRLHSTEQFPHTRRSCALEDILDLIQIEGAEFFNIQKEPLAEAQQYFGNRWHEVGDKLITFSDTVAWVQSMDLIICVDSALVHLAGSIGKPTKLALPFASDWRWQLHPSENPWYPSVHLYRQPAAGQWRAVFSTIAQDVIGGLTDA